MSTAYMNLWIQAHPADTCENVSSALSLIKDYFSSDDPEFDLSKGSRMGLVILLTHLIRATDFEANRLSNDASQRYSVDSLSEDQQEAIRQAYESIFDPDNSNDTPREE